MISFALVLILSFPWFAFPLSITDAHKEYLYGDYDKAIAIAKGLRENDETLYFLCLFHIKIGSYPKARIFLRKLIRRFPDSRFYDLGIIKLADTYFLGKDYAQAKAIYLKIADDSNTSNNMPLVLLRLAQIASREGDWAQKKKYLKQLNSQYPKSPEIRFAKVLEALGDFFTIQVGAFSVRANALALAEELRDDYSAYIVEDKKSTYPIYKVRIGRFKSYYDAKKVSAKLLNEGYPTRIYP